MSATILTPRLVQALDYAVIAHAGQLRKDTQIPYVAHLLGVCSLVLDHGGSEDQAIAGLLHDVLEDAGAGHESQIRARFGAAVAEMVLACSDGTVESKAAQAGEDRLASWRLRKQNYLQVLRHKSATHPALLVSACDKLHNARAILSDLRRLGPAIFERFSAGRGGTLWYYAELVDIYTANASPVAAELAHTVRQMQAEAG